ncbi:amino acid adenylation domain-containing protein [Skermanella aerolata]|uniref:non-ribosomal peptide synthetase n=1 Tax=Skermanella aerolata TaxID=393310 RepID=UPI003D1F13C4
MTAVIDVRPAPEVLDRRAMLADLLRRKAAEQVTRHRLSRGQEALWFLHRSAPDSAAYHVAFAARIVSPLDISALRRSLQALMDRHPLLRASFRLEDGVPVQDIPGYREARLEIVDCAGFTDEEVRDRVTAAYRRPFDLEAGGLFRASLLERSGNDAVLLLTVHHIVYDGWSLWVNLEELKELYAACASGSPLPPPRLAPAYGDHVAAQERLLDGPRGLQLEAFWKERLAGDLPLLDLPADRPRPPSQTFNGASRRFEIDRSLSLALKELAQGAGTTPFTLLLAAYQVLLARYSRQDEILVGTPVSGRSDRTFADTVGYFVNPVVMRADLSDDPTFRTFLERCHAGVLEALDHQDYPFPLLVERLKTRRDPSYSPVFQASFVLQKAQRAGSTLELAGGSLDWGGLKLEYYDLPQQEGQFDLELELMEVAGRFTGSFKYNSDLFDPATVGRMAGNFAELLRNVVKDADRPVMSIDMLSPAERDWLAQRNPTRSVQAPAIECVHDGFARRAAETPDAVALIFEDREMTYRELDERANRLANYLRARGAGPEILVGLCVERSFEMVVGILGILKAGAAYLPLDPASPPDRLAFIVEDSAASMLLTQAHLLDVVPEVEVETILLDGDWPQIARSPAHRPRSGVGPDNLIYVIYTSGTTGKPKGVQLTHGNVARLFSETRDWYRFGPDDVWTLFHSFAFDVSVWELWGALLHGGRIVIVPYLVSRSPSEFIDLLARHRVTVLNQSPSAFRLFVQAEQRKPLPEPTTLRAIIFAGEALDLQSLKPWVARHGDRKPVLVNMYGITETTVHSTFRIVRAEDLARTRSTIGAPIPDLQIRLLDRHMKPVPIGVAGEIYVGGAGVARGYLNRPHLTAERFLEDGCLEESFGGRLYKSGDLARYLPDGDIEYLGRLDKQVKIRGFRVELGEIEAALCAHPGIAAAIVVASARDGGDIRLIAYIVTRGAGVPDVTALRGQLADRLPEYMVPASFVKIDKLPLTGNGKLDYRSLPEPENLRTGAAPAVPPRDAVEQRLAGLWEKTLKLRPVGMQDDFFKLGGHSMLAVNLMAQVEKEFGRELPISALFRHPTVEQLAQCLREDAEARPWSPLVPIQISGDLPPFFCVAGGGGNVLYFHELAQNMPQDRPFYGLQLRGVDGLAEPLTSVEDIAADCVAAIRQVQPHGPYWIGGHCFGGLVAFEIAQRLDALGEEVALVAILDAPAPVGCQDRLNTICAMDDADWLAKIGSVLSEGTGQDLGIDPDELRTLPLDWQLAYVQERMNDAGLLPPGGGIAQVRGFLKVFVANSKARYAPRDFRPVPIALFQAGEFHADYDYSAAERHGAGLGWHAFSKGGVTVHQVPGNHITMLSGPNAAELARRLAAHLA